MACARGVPPWARPFAEVRYGRSALRVPAPLAFDSPFLSPSPPFSPLERALLSPLQAARYIVNVPLHKGGVPSALGNTASTGLVTLYSLPDAQWTQLPPPRLLDSANVSVIVPRRSVAAPATGAEEAEEVDLRGLRKLLTVRRVALIRCGAYLMLHPPALRERAFVGMCSRVPACSRENL